MTQDRPTAPELLDAVAEYLFAELRPQVPKEERFRVLVAANVCSVVARELRAGDEAALGDAAAFASLLERAGQEVRAADVHELAAELSARIRAGDFDERLPELAEELRAHVARKLAIARPGYAGG